MATNNMGRIILCALCFLQISIFTEGCPEDVMTTLGPVRGKLIDDAATGAYYYSFEAIPYAEPPKGSMRFKPPVRIKPWKKVFNATKPGYVCMQPEILYPRSQMSEDCLNFNIYTPANYMNKRLPVMVYVHAGYFKINSGRSEPTHGPQLLILNGIILVTMNYRLGSFGFLSACIDEATGNAGIKDVLLVLKIVQENIDKFGGDPNKVTLSGNGAGAAIVNYLMFSKQSKGLFSKVMIHSASVLSTRFTQIKPRKNARLLGSKLGVQYKNDKDLVQQLRKVNALKILEAEETIREQDPQRGYNLFYPFKPSVEIENPTAIITKSPLKLLEEGQIMNIPMIIGFNDQEGLVEFIDLKKDPGLINKFNADPELLIPRDILYPYGSEERKKLASRIKKFYFKGENISFVTIQNYLNSVADSQFTYSIDKFVKLFTAKKTAPVYYYLFVVDAGLNWFKIFQNITYPGAAHNDGIGYAFLTTATKDRYQNIDTETRRALETVMDSLKNFMTYGYPAPSPNVVYWPQAGKKRYYLKIGCKNVPVFNRPYPKRTDFWESVYDKYFNSNLNVSYFCNDDLSSST